MSRISSKSKKFLILSLIILFCLILKNSFLFFNRIEEKEENKKEEEEKSWLIIDMNKWREYFLWTQPTKLCKIPSKYSQIANGLCQIYLHRNCREIDCQMISSSKKNIRTLKCLSNGQIYKENSFKKPIECQIGASLDLFVDYPFSPSIIVDPLVEFSQDFYSKEIRRDQQSIWTTNFNFESISNYPWNKHVIKYLNFTFGYDRSLFDFIPKPWLFDYLHLIIRNQFNLTTKQIIFNKKRIYSNSSIDYFINHQNLSDVESKHVKSPIVWMNSNCRTRSKRDEYLNELMEYISIDNYGTCGNNQRKLPEHIIQIQKSQNKNVKERHTYNWLEGKLNLIKDYLFTIAFENSRDFDYITEKLWHPLLIGSIPVYYGAPNIDQWLPCQSNCIIDLSKFNSPKEAAQFLLNVAQNQTLYESFHSWRFEPLKKEFNEMINYFNRINNYSFDCILCSLTHQAKRNENISLSIQRLKQSIGHF